MYYNSQCLPLGRLAKLKKEMKKSQEFFIVNRTNFSEKIEKSG